MPVSNHCNVGLTNNDNFDLPKKCETTNKGEQNCFEYGTQIGVDFTFDYPHQYKGEVFRWLRITAPRQKAFTSFWQFGVASFQLRKFERTGNVHGSLQMPNNRHCAKG